MNTKFNRLISKILSLIIVGVITTVMVHHRNVREEDRIFYQRIRIEKIVEHGDIKKTIYSDHGDAFKLDHPLDVPLTAGGYYVITVQRKGTFIRHKYIIDAIHINPNYIPKEGGQ